MFGIGFFELVVIAVVALIFVGPKKLPEVMKQAGKFFVQVRRTANDVRSTFDEVVKNAEDELRKEEAEKVRGLLSTHQPGQHPVLEAAHHPVDDHHNPDGTLKQPPAPPPLPESGLAPDGAKPMGHDAAAPAAPATTASTTPDPMAGEAKPRT